MAAGKHNRARPRRVRPKKSRARRIVRSKAQLRLDDALGEFSEALALAETACNAFELAYDHMDSTHVGDFTVALRHGVDRLRRAYASVDVAICKVRA